MIIVTSKYWNCFNKKDINIIYIDELGEQLLKQYKTFMILNDSFRIQCGNILLVETISWKFHKNVLNFEIEADTNCIAISDIV